MTTTNSSIADMMKRPTSLIPKLRTILLLLIILFDNQIQTTKACSCAPENDQLTRLQRNYHDTTKQILKVKVLGSMWSAGPQKAAERERIHVAVVLRDFNDNNTKGQYVLIKSPSNHTCGLRLSKGRWVLAVTPAKNGKANSLSSSSSLGAYDVVECDYRVKWQYITEEDTDFLDSRMVCNYNVEDKKEDEKITESCKCGDWSQLKECVNPCITSSCEGATSCKPNYCGGCKAEWMDDEGRMMCQE